ncbi:hypothetical protein [Kribbella speibonae]|uniref:ImmA/IrrE family metallo-endopeptidase n=1 Tax=Kribbella speibonae TaxID=1572660 RepID=A0A4R0IXV9_9ACTN|nr:hypothetical protein [Kribbella speibonae]TCC38873.1 hypothetical protein E0H92_21130 [Kribbella speibonae]
MRWLDAAAVLHGQSFRNVVLIKLQLPHAMWVEGRQGWQRRGRRVVRGTSGIRIVASSDDTEHPVGPVQGHGVATVWDVSQTDGPRAAQPAVAEIRPADVVDALTRVAVAAGYRVGQGQLSMNASGAETDHRRRRIVIADGLDDPVAVMSLAHELAHLRMHKLSRGAGCYGLTRLEAQSVAYMLLARFGVTPDAASRDLITSAAGTIGKSPSVRLVETLGGRVVATARRLIDATTPHLGRQAQLRPPGTPKPFVSDTEHRAPDLGL